MPEPFFNIRKTENEPPRPGGRGIKFNGMNFGSAEMFWLKRWKSVCVLAAALIGWGAAEAAKIEPLDLRGAANTTFRDETADDRKGGWTDQGSNDLRMIGRGKAEFGGIPFEIPADGENGGNSCIVLGDKAGRSYLPQSATLTLSKPVAGGTLYLLNAAAWCGKSGSIAGRLTAHYADGSTFEWRVRVGRDTGDWWNFSGGTNSIRVWSKYNGNSQVSLFVSRFQLADKPLASLTFTSGEAVWMIAAVSVGEKAEPKALAKRWELTGDYAGPETPDPKIFASIPTSGIPRNVIFIIGDGMGQGAWKLASLHAHGAEGKLYMEQLPVRGLATTHSASSPVTDSAASGTALSSGYKTANSFVGMDPDKVARVTIAEAARDTGRSVGVMTTDKLTGATPAAFSAHVSGRGMADDIALQQGNCNFDILIGSGIGPFLPKTEGGPGSRSDNTDVTAMLRGRGYAQVSGIDEFRKAPEGKVFGFFDGWKDTQLLSEYAREAFTRLEKNPKGFFIMIEGHFPDGGGHGNRPDVSVMGTLMVDTLVREAVQYALVRGDTLVLVTADHETGGLRAAPNTRNPARPYVHYMVTSHTGDPVCVSAFGPGSEGLHGVIDNTDIPRLIARLWEVEIGQAAATPAE